MNKFLQILKISIIIILTFLIINYIFIYGIDGNSILTFLIAYFSYLVLMVVDIVKKNSIIKNNMYNILNIIVFSIISLIFIRTLYDKSLLYNSIEFLNNISDVSLYNISFVNQNIIYFIIMLICLFVYRQINVDKIKYNIISIICIIITFILTVSQLPIVSPICFIFLNVLIIIVHTWSLFKYNHQRYDWTVYIGWLYNLLAIVGCLMDNFIL